MIGNPTETSVCYHCGNMVPLRRVAVHHGQELYEHIDGHRFNEDFDYFIYQCPTCNGISIYGDFVAYRRNPKNIPPRIYPAGSRLLPESHKLASSNCIPARILKLYDEIWPLRHIAPNAFAGQIRRALEFICQDQKAIGATLFKQLEYLVSRGTFPGHFAEITDLMRHVGNLGAHAAEEDLDFWDAELLDEFFRSVVEYVYFVPQKIERLKQRINFRNKNIN